MNRKGRTRQDIFIRIIFGWLRSPNVFSITTLTVTSADDASATENAVFAKLEMGEKRLNLSIS